MTPSDLKGFGLLQEFSDEDREALFDLLEEVVYRAGRSLYRETAEADGLVLLVSGTATLESSHAPELGSVTAGAVLGVASLLSLGRREATVKAETECRALVLPRGAYRRLVDDYPRVACRLNEAIATHLAGLLREGLGRLATAP